MLEKWNIENPDHQIPCSEIDILNRYPSPWSCTTENDERMLKLRGEKLSAGAMAVLDFGISSCCGFFTDFIIVFALMLICPTEILDIYFAIRTKQQFTLRSSYRFLSYPCTTTCGCAARREMPVRVVIIRNVPNYYEKHPHGDCQLIYALLIDGIYIAYPHGDSMEVIHTSQSIRKMLRESYNKAQSNNDKWWLDIYAQFPNGNREITSGEKVIDGEYLLKKGLELENDQLTEDEWDRRTPPDTEIPICLERLFKEMKSVLEFHISNLDKKKNEALIDRIKSALCTLPVSLS